MVLDLCITLQALLLVYVARSILNDSVAWVYCQVCPMCEWFWTCVLLYKPYCWCMLPGAAYACSEWVIRDLVNATRLPFLPTAMGKGVVPDSHPLSVAAARSK